MPALPFIELLENGEFSINEKAGEFLERLGAPLVVVACAGKYRSGKSSLLNRVLLDVEGSDGFGVGQTVNAQTKGIWIHTNVLGVKRQSESGKGRTRSGKKENAVEEVVNVLIMDTEGLGAFNATSTHDCKIFSLALLLSSFFIYNSVGNIDEQAISTLSLVANISRQVQARSEKGNEESGEELSKAKELGEFFPDFAWLVRDFALQLKDEKGREITPNQYLEQALSSSTTKKDEGDPEGEKDQLRALLRAYFPRRQCLLLVRPCANEEDLQRIDTMPKSEMRPEFWQAASVVRSTILKNAPPKKADGREISGRALLRLAKTFVDAMNRGAAPVIRDSWALLVEVQFRDALESCLEQWERSVGEKKECGSEEELRKVLSEAREAALKVFKKEAPEKEGEGVLFAKFYGKAVEVVEKAETKKKEEWKRSVVQRVELAVEKVFGKEYETAKDFLVAWETLNFVGLDPSLYAPLVLPRLFDLLLVFGERADVSKKVDEWVEKYKKVEAELETVKAQKEEKEAELVAYREHIAALESEREEEDAKREEVSREGEALREEEVLREEEEAKREERERELELLKGEVELAREEAKEKVWRLERQLKEIQKSTVESLEEIQKSNAATKKELEEEVEQKERQYEVEKREHGKLKRKYQDVEQKMVELNDEVERLKEEAKAGQREQMELVKTTKTLETKFLLLQQKYDGLVAKTKEVKPNVEAEKANAVLQKVEEECKRIRGELFECKRLLDEKNAAVRKLEHLLVDQQREHESALHSLRLNYEVEAAKERARMVSEKRAKLF